jgi:hypothetical protein
MPYEEEKSEYTGQNKTRVAQEVREKLVLDRRDLRSVWVFFRMGRWCDCGCGRGGGHDVERRVGHDGTERCPE